MARLIFYIWALMSQFLNLTFDRLFYFTYTEEFICCNFNCPIYNFLKLKIIAILTLNMIALKFLTKKGQVFCVLVGFLK